MAVLGPVHLFMAVTICIFPPELLKFKPFLYTYFPQMWQLIIMCLMYNGGDIVPLRNYGFHFTYINLNYLCFFLLINLIKFNQFIIIVIV